MIIAGFPGVGKTEAFKKFNEIIKERELSLKVLDSDSSQFSWIDAENKIRNPDFPNNYIDHILSNDDNETVIFTSTHNVVLNILVTKVNHLLLIICPKREDKEIYKQRYIDRGSSQEFINNIMNNWDKYLDDIESLENVEIIHLPTGQYLSDVVYINKEEE